MCPSASAARGNPLWRPEPPYVGEASKKQGNAQLASVIIMAGPGGLPADQYESLVREYCMEQFVLRA